MDFLLDFLLEFLLEIILNGALESVSEKKVPMFVRVMTAILLLGFYIGLGALLIYIGITNKNGIIIGVAIFLYIVIAIAVVNKYNKMKK